MQDKIIQNISSKPVDDRIPWERRKEIGFLRALLQTAMEALFSPGHFFTRMSMEGGIGEPFLFAFIIGTVCTWVGALFQVILQIVMFLAMRSAMEEMIGEEMLHPGYYILIAVGLILLIAPIAVCIFLFVTAGIFHLVLTVCRGSKSGFEATFRTVAYSASASAFNMIPFIGPFITAIWAVVCAAIGTKIVNGISTGKAVLVAIITIIAFFVLMCGLAIISP